MEVAEKIDKTYTCKTNMTQCFTSTWWHANVLKCYCGNTVTVLPKNLKCLTMLTKYVTTSCWQI